MRSLRTVTGAALTTVALVTMPAPSAFAQVSLDPTSSPALNDSPTGPLGPLPSIADLLFWLGVVVLILMVVAYMRYAPRFSRDEERFKVVRADRVRVGQELPRRAVDISQAVDVVVAPPAVPSAAPPPAPAPAAAPAPAPAAAPASAPAPAPAAPAAAAPSPPPASADAAPASPAPAAEAPAVAAPAAAAPAATEERPEVSLDEAVFQQTLDDLLAKGTSRRVAEGQARRAAMLAARKKATGG
jgi:2-oxoglutarate dehydrogenase E2 component (dihydrolipoamide succinyltransferase)